MVVGGSCYPYADDLAPLQVRLGGSSVSRPCLLLAALTPNNDTDWWGDMASKDPAKSKHTPNNDPAKARATPRTSICERPRRICLMNYLPLSGFDRERSHVVAAPVHHIPSQMYEFLKMHIAEGGSPLDETRQETGRYIATFVKRTISGSSIMHEDGRTGAGNAPADPA